MTDATWKIQVSPKIGDTLVNVRADSADELAQLLSWLEQNATTVQSTIQALQAQSNVAASFPGSQNVQAPPQQDGPLPWAGQQPAQPAQQQGPSPQCSHGAMTYREGNGRKGPWKAWFCPTPKGTPNQCQPQFV